MADQAEKFITVVSGLPRSGTSMMMQMLHAGGMQVLADQIRKADEDNQEGYYEYEVVKSTRSDASWVDEARGKAVKVIYMLLADLPSAHRYRVIFMRRPVQQVVRSQQVMLQRRGEKGADMSAEQMAEIFRRQLEKTDRWLAEQTNIQLLDVPYQEVINDPQSHAQRIGSFLETELDTVAMVSTVQPSLHRQR